MYFNRKENLSDFPSFWVEGFFHIVYKNNFVLLKVYIFKIVSYCLISVWDGE